MIEEMAEEDGCDGTRGTHFCVGLLIINGKTLKVGVDPADVEVLVMAPGRQKGDGSHYSFSTITGHKSAGESVARTITREAQEEGDVRVGLFSDPEEPFYLFEPNHRIGSKKFDNIIAGYLCLAIEVGRNREIMEAKSVVFVRVGELLEADVDDFTRVMLERFSKKEVFSEFLEKFVEGAEEEMKNGKNSFFGSVSQIFKKKNNGT